MAYDDNTLHYKFYYDRPVGQDASYFQILRYRVTNPDEKDPDGTPARQQWEQHYLYLAGTPDHGTWAWAPYSGYDELELNTSSPFSLTGVDQAPFEDGLRVFAKNRFGLHVEVDHHLDDSVKKLRHVWQ